METFTCTQHGCEIEADAHPENCPVCNNPQNVNGADNGELWNGYGIVELKQTAKDWGLTGYSHLNKAELIDLLKAADDDAGNGDD